MNGNNNTLLNEHKRTNFDIQPSFEELLTQNGYPAINLMRDGKPHRFGKDDRLWYSCHETHAVAGDWSEELPFIKWCNKTQWASLSKPEQESKRSEIKALQEQNERERIELQNQAKNHAQEVIVKSSKSGVSEYLKKKKLDAENGIYFGKNGEIFIPIFDIDGELAEKSPERDYREYDKVNLDKHNETYFKKLIYSYAESFYKKTANGSGNIIYFLLQVEKNFLEN